ncbi:MAG TPA: DUF1648 domain-containing protein [Acidimicrobiales bacterium]
MAERTRRLLLGVVLPIVILGLAVLPWIVGWGDLPATVATHFDAGGAADGSAPRAVQAAASALAGLAAAALLARTSRRRPDDVDRSDLWTTSAQAGVWAFLGVLMGVVSVQIVSANHGLADWHDARLGLGWVVAAIVASIGAAALAVTIAQGLAPETASSAAPVAGVPLATGERAVWFGHARSKGFLVGGLALVVVAGVVLALVGITGGLGLTLLLVGLVLSLFSSVEVRVDGVGVHVRSGAVPGVRVELPLAEIVAARTIDLNPMGWGGWGYRGSLRLFRRAAWVLRAGPSLELELSGGRRFAVTVDGAEDAAALVNALLAQTT